MQLEDIEEEKEKHWAKPDGRKQSKARCRSESLEAGSHNKPEVRRGSNLLAAAGIDFERRRKQLHSQVSTGANSETRIFQEGNQWLEEKDGEITKLELVEVKERMGRMRKAVPILPFALALTLCLLNFFLPSVGTFIGVGTLLCGAKCRHEKTSQGIKYGILAGVLQLLLTPILVGWIFSIYYGANIVQDSVTKGAIQPEPKKDEDQADTDTTRTPGATSNLPEMKAGTQA